MPRLRPGFLLLSSIHVPVPIDAIPSGGFEKSPGREKWGASFGTGSCLLAPNSLAEISHLGSTRRQHSQDLHGGDAAPDVEKFEDVGLDALHDPADEGAEGDADDHAEEGEVGKEGAAGVAEAD